ncbi:SAM-dependent DNA methyltransferase [Nannocystis pusilla]|uniref:SAM-dependent DNA methyltransferase n=1 Tax=Nannocystis pusilla TaxID=889268 RepID=UPI003DA27BFB
MGKLRSDAGKVEFGDFQTPIDLADEVCELLASRGVAPGSVVEPTCGVGNLLVAALEAFPDVRAAHGMEVNEAYVSVARARLAELDKGARAEVERANFFEADWPSWIARLPEPILFVGNPPWVTSADLGYLKSHNIPEKTNFHGRAGLDAITGKSNFDISEWLLVKLLSWLAGRRATIAMLCKTAVARKVLLFGWQRGFNIGSAAMYGIDSAKHFGAGVDACLFVCELEEASGQQVCAVFPSLRAPSPAGSFGYREGALVADTVLYDRWKCLIGESHYKWRSGVKHDCAAVMELACAEDGRLVDGTGESVAIEGRFLYPMLKSSDVAREGQPVPRRWMIVPQTFVGEDTAAIAKAAPRTWAYLSRHRARFDRRASSIYKGKPAFSVFGVGDYTFSPWKVAISGLYKKLEFKVIGPFAGKPVVLDDTCYFLPCATEAEARLLGRMLGSSAAQEFFSAFVFWDAKRPITTELLRRLDLARLAAVLGVEEEFREHWGAGSSRSPEPAVEPAVARARG